MFALDHTRPLGEQLTAALRTAVVEGTLGAGTRLPASRELATELGVSRGLVVAAYEQLVAEGRLESRRGSGTFVADVPAPRPAPAGVVPWLGPVGQELPAPLRPGIPDLGQFPRRAWRRAYETALREATVADLDYGDPAGAPRLRAELAGYLSRVRAARIDPGRLLVTTGAAQALALIAAALRERSLAGADRGRGSTGIDVGRGSAGADVARGGTGIDGERGGAGIGDNRIGVEDPGSPPIRAHLEAAGLAPVPVPVDQDGLDVAVLDRLGLPAVVVTPAHQFPTGVVLSAARRAELVAWARRRDGLIIEDDYDSEFRYDRDPVGTVQGLAPDVVALVGSVSKALAPALRLGWLAVPEGLWPAAVRAKSAADHGGPVLEQLAFARLLADGGYDRHLRSVRRIYRRRRDAAVAVLARHLPAGAVGGVAAGMHLVAVLPAGCDDVALAHRAAARGLGVLPLSATRFAPLPADPPGLVIGYATGRADELAQVLRDLG